MGVKNNTKYFRMQREYQRRSARLNYYKNLLKEEEHNSYIYNKELNKFKLENPSPSRFLLNQFNSKFNCGKNDQLVIFYTTKINNIQKL